MGEADRFDTVTAVNDSPIPPEARPTVDSMEELSLSFEHSGTSKVMAAIDEPTQEPASTERDAAATEEQPPLVDSAGEIEAREPPPARGAAAPTEADDGLSIPHQADEPDSDKVADRIAEQRGLPPIAEPYVRDPEPVPRRWLYASVAVSVVCLCITAGAVMWARAEVRAARQAQGAHPHELVAMKQVEAAAVADVAPSAGNPAPAPEVTLAAVATSCALRITASVKDSEVWVDGIARGKAPVELPVACGHDSSVEVRHPRYEDFKRTLAAGAGTASVEAKLEREKTELTVWSEPAGATVTYNGTVLGKTPLVTKVNRFEQGTLKFRAPGMAADWRRIVPKQATKTVSVTLKPAS